MSVAGDNIARATAAGLRAAQLAQIVHCAPGQRHAIRAWLLDHEPGPALELLAELEARWAALDVAGTGSLPEGKS